MAKSCTGSKVGTSPCGYGSDATSMGKADDVPHKTGEPSENVLD